MRHILHWYRENLPALFIDIAGLSVLLGMHVFGWVLF